MKTITTRIYRATQAGETIFMSIEELGESELDDHYCRNRDLPLTITVEELDIPLIDSEIQMWTSMWDGGEGLAPHLHFKCPKCNRDHCVDLEDGDTNPRFACCDACLWDSLAWLNWDEEKVEQGSEQDGGEQAATRSESACPS